MSFGDVTAIMRPLRDAIRVLFALLSWAWRLTHEGIGAALEQLRGRSAEVLHAQADRDRIEIMPADTGRGPWLLHRAQGNELPSTQVSPEHGALLATRRVDFTLGESLVLRRTLRLPGGLAARDLESAVLLKLEREAPRPLDQLEVRFTVVEVTPTTDTPAATIVHAALVERAAILDLRVTLAAYGARVRRIRVAAGPGALSDAADGTPDPLDFSSVGRRAWRARTPTASAARPWTRTDRMLIVTSIALLIGALGTVVGAAWHEWREVEQLRAQLREQVRILEVRQAALTAKARPTAELRRLLETPDAAARFLTLHGLVGPDTWSHDLSIRTPLQVEGSVTLSGLTPSARELANRLETAPSLAQVKLTSQSFAGVGLGKDRFTLTGTWESPPQARMKGSATASSAGRTP